MTSAPGAPSRIPCEMGRPRGEGRGHWLDGAVSAPLELRIDDGLARITFDRPDKLNAFDAELAEAWRDATRTATTTAGVGAILLAGRGRAFCAGGDVRAMKDLPGSRLSDLADVINEGLLALLESDIPVVAAAHGTTAGGGLGVLLASDYAIVGTDSRLGSLYANVGLTPDLSVSALLSDAVGERRALQLVLTDRMLTADEALDWGLVAEVVDPADVLTRAEQVAQSWLSGATLAYGQAKRLIRSRRSRTLAEQLAEEGRTIGAALDGDEGRSRVTAF